MPLLQLLLMHIPLMLLLLLLLPLLLLLLVVLLLLLLLLLLPFRLLIVEMPLLLVPQLLLLVPPLLLRIMLLVLHAPGAAMTTRASLMHSSPNCWSCITSSSSSSGGREALATPGSCSSCSYCGSSREWCAYTTAHGLTMVMVVITVMINADRDVADYDCADGALRSAKHADSSGVCGDRLANNDMPMHAMTQLMISNGHDRSLL